LAGATSAGGRGTTEDGASGFSDGALGGTTSQAIADETVVEAVIEESECAKGRATWMGTNSWSTTPFSASSMADGADRADITGLGEISSKIATVKEARG